jgi:DNA-binding XRE family transcriptional regulator
VGTKKWSEIRRTKVPDVEEAAVAASGRALREALRLHELRSAKGLTQTELGNRLGISQVSVSQLERREDVYLSTLREYIEALGGELEVAAVFNGERSPIAVG